MSRKNKLGKFAENKTFKHYFEPKLHYSMTENFVMKSVWNKDFFKNENPIVVELGCGKGEYTVNLAQQYPDRNFIGVDIKGARLWRGLKTSAEEESNNVAFIRTRVEFAPLCFDKSEVQEIWITFPDPQLGSKKMIKKRLTSSRFLSYYQKFLIHNGIVNLKTDDPVLYKYTKEVIELNQLEVICDTDNLYESDLYVNELTIRTHYEKMWNKENRVIKYLKFRLPSDLDLQEPEFDDDQE